MNDVRTRITSLIVISYYLVIIDDKDIQDIRRLQFPLIMLVRLCRFFDGFDTDITAKQPG